MKLVTFSVLLLATSIQPEKVEFFWREYFGEIPDDAFPGGFNQNHEPRYVGQVYIPNHGILPTTIDGGQKSVTTSRNGIHTSDMFIKILCSKELEKLTWILITSETNFNDTIAIGERKLVTGGTEDGKELYVGRVFYQGEDIIGKVSVNNNTAVLYFPYRGEEIATSSFKLLIHANVY